MGAVMRRPRPLAGGTEAVSKKSLGSLQTFGPITLSPRPSGRWAISWALEWEFGELQDALVLMGKLTGIVRAAAIYRVHVRITPEPQAKGQKP